VSEKSFPQSAFSAKCKAHLKESIFQTRSDNIFGYHRQGYFYFRLFLNGTIDSVRPILL